jgi:hypothetical protein
LFASRLSVQAIAEPLSRSFLLAPAASTADDQIIMTTLSAASSRDAASVPLRPERHPSPRGRGNATPPSQVLPRGRGAPPPSSQPPPHPAQGVDPSRPLRSGRSAPDPATSARARRRSPPGPSLRCLLTQSGSNSAVGPPGSRGSRSCPSLSRTPATSRARGCANCPRGVGCECSGDHHWSWNSSGCDLDRGIHASPLEISVCGSGGNDSAAADRIIVAGRPNQGEF